MIMDNKEVKVELETLSSHFIEHNHNPNDTDFVICLLKDKELPVKVIEVSIFEYSRQNKSDDITIRGEKELWLDFAHKVKKDRKKVWEVLRPFLNKYIRTDEQTRLLLLLFPKNLLDELLKKENPDSFVQQAIRERLAAEK